MKIWNSFGSEHSANLVMVGRFKDAASAEKAKEVIDKISDFVLNSEEKFEGANRYSDQALELLKTVNFYSVSPAEFEQFRYEVMPTLEGNKLFLRTDDIEISAVLKIMVENGARVEVYSAHTYPDSTDTTET
jgi:Family of unknown function (DUF6375)